MEEVFSLKDFEKSCLIQSLLWISVNWVTWQVFEREVKTALHLMQYMFNKCGDLETGVCGFCRHWNTICEKSVQRAFGFFILYEVEGNTFKTSVAKARSMSVFVGANLGKFTVFYILFYSLKCLLSHLTGQFGTFWSLLG